jgi:hypothetical protein
MERTGEFEYGRHYRISVEAADEGYTAWIERFDRRPISCGYSFAEAVGTPQYEAADAAIAAAKAMIDTGAVKLQP